MVVAGLLPFALLPWLCWRFRELNADPRLRACLWLFLPPFLFFLYKASRDRLEPNWPLACYIAFCPLAVYWFEQMRGRAVLQWLGSSAYVLPILATVVLTWHLISPLEVVPPDKDRLHRHGSWDALAEDVSSAVRGLDPNASVYVKTYQDTSYLRFHKVRAEQLPGESRPSHFTQRMVKSELPTHFLVLSHHPPYLPGFAPPELLGEFPLTVRGEIIGTYQLLRYQKSGSQRTAKR
jgi:hypothetical protein